MRPRRLRCCGRFCWWRAPLGPWCCSVCDRRFDGPMPRNAVGRFWAWIDLQVAAASRPADPELLALFRGRR